MSDDRCLNCNQTVRVISYALGERLMHVDPNASFPTEQKGTAWRHCKQRVAMLPPKPVDGLTDTCPTPGYAGVHVAVGAGAVGSPYLCHGCGTWFTLPEDTSVLPPAEAVERCPECRHMPHGSLGFCPNMASDNECSCTYVLPPGVGA